MMRRRLVVSKISTLDVGSPLARLAPRWLIKVLNVEKEKTMQSLNEEMAILIGAVKNTTTPMEIP